MRTELRGGFALLLALLVGVAAAAQVEKAPERVSYLDAGSIVDYQPLTRHRGFFENDGLRTYCYRGSGKTLARIFESVELQLDIEGDDYTQYEGASPAEVRQHRDEQRSLFSFSLFSQKRTRLPLSPFAMQCIGIETTLPYRVRLLQMRVDFWRVIQLVAGVALFVYAGHLSHNSLFYYITGIALGICSSFMLLIWLSSKLVPRRTMMYGVLIGGWTIGIYIIQMLWENLQLIVLTYRSYVFWYILVTGLVSFFFCYRLGPPKNKRSKNIIKWLLQLMALVLIYFASYFEEATAAIVLISAFVYYFPRSLWHRTRAFYLRRFPPKQRLLTNEEYYEQGVRETTKALEELRRHASSPDCKQWKIMTKLSDPLRFAAFVEGASHLRDEEILHFEYSRQDTADDDSEFSSDANEEAQHENGGDSFVRRRTQHYSGEQQSLRRGTLRAHEDMSEDEDLDGEVVEVATNSRRTPTLNNSRLYFAPHYSSPLRARSNVPTLSSVKISSAKRNGSTYREYSDAGDGC